MRQRLLVVSPVRDEAKNIRRVASALAAQTRPPDTWLVIDDDSSDGTSEILGELAAEIPFLQMATRTKSTDAAPDRLAMAAEASAFNEALSLVSRTEYTHVSKLDGDIELPREYFERLLAEFETDPELGLAGGVLLERSGDSWVLDSFPYDYHVRGALKCYSLACFEAIGGIHERLGWDTIDEVYARMSGFRTRSLPELVGRHHRPLASADGVLRGKARYGRTYYVLHFPPAWVALRALKTGLESPRGLSGLWFFAGYLHAAFTRASRVDDPAYRRWIRRELATRAVAGLARIGSAG